MLVPRTLVAVLAAVSLAVPLYVAAQTGAAGDELRSVLVESKEKNRGVAIYVNGVTVNAVVVSVDDKYVVAKSQQSSKIVIRLDRIDGVSAFF